MDKDIVEAHNFSSKHRTGLEKDLTCGCFYCMNIFNPNDVENWLNEGPGTALCPYCGIDSIVGAHSGFAITKEFLGRMNKYWFKK